MNISHITKHAVRLDGGEKFQAADDYAEQRQSVEVDAIEFTGSNPPSVYFKGFAIGTKGQVTGRRTGFYGEVKDIPQWILVGLVESMIDR